MSVKTSARRAQGAGSKVVLALGTAAIVLGLAGASAGGAPRDGDEHYAGLGHDTRESTAGNPCLGPRAKFLLCPNLKISGPEDMYMDTTTRPGKRLLRATNNIRSRGAGPAEIRGIRITPDSMRVNQRIHKRGGGILSLRTTGYLDWYPVPGQYYYWKFRDAARFELWDTDKQGRPAHEIRIGPKLHYCLRDLQRTRPGPHSPRNPVYPGCSQDHNIRSRILGTSVGWSDIYPSDYNQNWINVTGLRGCYAYVLVVDPMNHIRESNEKDNSGRAFVRLPSGRRVHSCRQAPGGIGSGS